MHWKETILHVAKLCFQQVSDYSIVVSLNAHLFLGVTSLSRKYVCIGRLFLSVTT